MQSGLCYSLPRRNISQTDAFVRGSNAIMWTLDHNTAYNKCLVLLELCFLSTDVTFSKKAVITYLYKSVLVFSENHCHVQPHSRSQSPRFFSLRGRRNEGLCPKQLPDVRKFLTSGSICAVVNNVSAHAQKCIFWEGRDILSFVITR